MEHAVQPHPWIIVPFVLLLMSIALAPLFFAKFWHKHYPKVAFGLAAITLFYYLFILEDTGSVLHIAHEYVSFILLIGALFVVSGGIHITVKGEATPMVNVVFLFVGALLSNILGTTGASMLLIRPWIRMNKYRITAHHIVFFIFVVSNIGGCLTPIGDPPLFLGYLRGIPFWWVIEHCWGPWLCAMGLLLGIFFVIDHKNYLKAPRAVREELAEPADKWKFEGGVNLFFLGIILWAVFVNDPPFLRESMMLAAALGSYYVTSKSIHQANHFNFEPIREVAILFIGIFATMLPALNWLEHNAKNLGMTTPSFFYWGSGFLSSVLDNAPTYYSFLSAILGVFVQPDAVEHVKQIVSNGGTNLLSATIPQSIEIQSTLAALQKYNPAALAEKSVTREQIEIAYLLGNATLRHFITAISVGSVFFGAFTYIGNGPNFMVKSIADHQKIHCPGFISFVLRWSVPFLLPVLIVIWLLFFI
jgi:Na+/H+ antiporter NhaD/arsenite permease-like protein